MTAAILLMAGASERLPGSTPKQYRLLKGLAVYQHTLKRFQEMKTFQQIILVTNDVAKVSAESQGVTVVAGGSSRRESSYKGLLACSSDIRYVVIHDAVRPLVSERIIKDNLAALEEYEAVDTCLPSSDTIVEKAGDFVQHIPDRALFWRGQTPQSFSYDIIKRAHEQAPHVQQHVDDCRLVLELGIKPYIVLGEERNLKITTEEDFLLVQQLCP
jgi:2-C-methyl-D-erythritol 4-phosphate cytidylyltransferase